MKKIIFLVLLLTPLFAIANPSTKLTVVLDWFPNPDHAPLIIAKQKGFFQSEGIEIELIAPTDPNDPPKWVAAKKADIGITYEPSFFEQVDRGLPLIHIGNLVDHPLNCLVALKSNDIHRLSDLKNKRIGSTTGSLSSIMLKTMLEKQGLTEQDVSLVNVKYNLTQALLSHRVDAVTGLMRNVEVPMLELNHHQATIFLPEQYGLPTYNELIFVTHLENTHNQAIMHFLTAIKKATAYLADHPEESWEIFIKEYPEANNAVNKKSWFITLPYFAKNPAFFNGVEWKKFGLFMQKNQLIKKLQPLSRYSIVSETNNLVAAS